MNQTLRVANSSLIRCPSPASWAFTLESEGALIKSDSGVMPPVLAGSYLGLWTAIWKGLQHCSGNVTIKCCSMHVVSQFNRDFKINEKTLHLKLIAEECWRLCENLGNVRAVFTKKERLGIVKDLAKEAFDLARLQFIDFTRSGSKDKSDSEKLRQISKLLADHVY